MCWSWHSLYRCHPCPSDRGDRTPESSIVSEPPRSYTGQPLTTVLRPPSQQLYDPARLRIIGWLATDGKLSSPCLQYRLLSTCYSYDPINLQRQTQMLRYDVLAFLLFAALYDSFLILHYCQSPHSLCSFIVIHGLSSWHWLNLLQIALGLWTQ